MHMTRGRQATSMRQVLFWCSRACACVAMLFEVFATFLKDTHDGYVPEPDRNETLIATGVPY